MDILQGKQNSYIIDGRLGRRTAIGGTLTAHDERGNRFTIKRLERAPSSLPSLLQKVTSLKREDIVPIAECIPAPDGCTYSVRPFLEGTDLKSLFADKSLYGKVPENNFLQLGCAVLNTLEALHAANILHRDIKPSNIIIRHAPNTSVLDADFSLIALTDFEQCIALPPSADCRTFFSLIYSPPEMLLKRSNMLCPSVDLFALAITIYHLVMGKTPYSDCNPDILINLQLTYSVKRPARMSPDLFDVLNRAAFKEPFRLAPRKLSDAEIDDTLRRGIDKRYQSAAEMRSALEKVSSALTPQNWLQRLIN